jgi:NADH dehydrogenase FAD-containing subunit
VPNLSKKAQAQAWIHLRSKNVKIITSEECIQKDADTLITKSGNYAWSTKEENTLFLWCVRGSPRTSFMEKHFAMSLDPDKFIKVDEYFRVAGLSNVFAAGDVTSLKGLFLVFYSIYR